MNQVSGQVIEILQFLLPGFVTAMIFYSLTAYPKPSTFERVVQALIFTIVIQAMVQILFWAGSLFSEIQLSSDDQKVAVAVASVLVAVFLGLGVAYISNNDTFHRPLRNWNITRATSYPSEWYSAFSANDDNWVILHLKDKQRIYGWPTEWPGQSGKGHFYLEGPARLTDDDELDSPLRFPILVPASKVEMVEFIVPQRHTE